MGKCQKYGNKENIRVSGWKEFDLDAHLCDELASVYFER